MIARGRPTRVAHPHLAEGTGQRDLARGGHEVGVLVVELLLDESSRVVGMAGAALFELFQQIGGGEFVGVVDGHREAFTQRVTRFSEFRHYEFY